MSERTGTCIDCGQRYGDIPDSVTATKVKCQVCSGTVEIPPLAASAPAPPEPATPAPPAAAPSVVPPASGLTAKPLGKEAQKTERPSAAAPVDRGVARPAKEPAKAVKPVAKKPAGAAPGKPVFARKTAAPGKPIKPVKPAAPVKPIRPVKAAATVKPIRPVKAAAPAKPLKPAAAPPAQKAAPVASAKSVAPSQPTSDANAEAAKKARAAEIIARAKAKRAQAAEESAPKASGAELIAKLKAKKEGAPEAAAPKAVAVAKAAQASSSRRQSKTRGKAAPARKRPGRNKEEREESIRNAREHANEHKGWVLGLVSVAGLAIIGGGWWWMNNLDDDTSQETGVETSAGTNAGTEQVPVNPDSLAPAQGAPILDVPAAPADDSGENAGGYANAAGTETEGSGTDAAGGSEAASPPKPVVKAPSAEFTPPLPGEAANTRGISDFYALDLSLIPSIEQWQQCSDEDYASIKEDLALFLDDAGVQSTRAGDRMIEHGRSAYAVVVNNLMQQDFSTKDGMYIATTLNDLLYKICDSNKNFGWENTAALEEGSEEYLDKALMNKKISAMWQRYWYIQNFANDDKAWDKMCGRAVATTEEAAPPSNSTEDFFDD